MGRNKHRHRKAEPDLAALYETARVAANQGRHKEAVDIMRKVVQTNPENAEAWHHFAVMALVAGQPEAALTAANRSIQLSPTYDTWGIVAEIHLDSMRISEAKQALQKMLELKPGDMKAELLLTGLRDFDASQN